MARLVLAVLLAGAVQLRYLFDGVPEQRVIVIIRTAGFAGALDAPPEILLEVFESKNVAVNEAPVERLFDQNYQIAHAQHRNGALPADPDVVLCLRSHFNKGIVKEPACYCPIEFS